MRSKINPNESDFVKDIRNTHCKGCIDENGYCDACSVLDCWLRNTYLPKDEWKKAMVSDIEQKITNELAKNIDEEITNKIFNNQ